ncbi:MAG TPA: cysteine hydrolase [Ktedonobacterales bacterium]|nr:cysteine hydrolase [Ktedonobacterales bacterium]
MTFGVDSVRPAVVAIDLHRGHLDPAVATMPVIPGTEARIIEANRRFFEGCRAANIPIVHLLTTYRDVSEIRSMPFWRALADDPKATRRNNERHNLQGSPGCQIIPELYDEQRDWVVDSKKRYNCFQDTDLHFVLRAHGINTLLITGVNTNSCVLATTTAASCLDYAVIVVEDCVDSMDGPAMHEAALACIRTAFGWVMPSAEVLAQVAQDVAPATV